MNTLPRAMMAAALLALAATPAIAQETRADSMVTLLEAFLVDLASRGIGRPEILLGELRPPLSSLSLPAGISVIGTLDFPTQGFSIVQGAAGDAVGEALAERLVSAGWTMLPPERRAGFTDSSFARKRVLCHGESGVEIHSKAEGEDDGRVMVVYGENGSVTRCRRPPLEGMGPRRHIQSPLPRLKPPPDGRVAGPGGGGGGDDSWSSYTTIRTDLSLEPLARHFAEQLEAAGADLEDAVIGADVVAQRLQLWDEQGRLWVGTLVVSTGPADLRRVYVDVLRMVPR